jgi:hypothetical protein
MRDSCNNRRKGLSPRSNRRPDGSGRNQRRRAKDYNHRNGNIAAIRELIDTEIDAVNGGNMSQGQADKLVNSMWDTIIKVEGLAAGPGSCGWAVTSC